MRDGLRRLPTSDRWTSRPARITVVLTAAILFAGCTALRWDLRGPADAVALLYSVPVALLALVFGARGGAASALGAVGSLVAWALATGTGPGPVGWAGRVVPLLLLGVLVGVLADRLRAHASAPAARVPQARRAVDAYDDLIQALTVAKWSLESGQAEQALGIVTEAVERGRREQPALAREAGLERHWTAPGLN